VLAALRGVEFANALVLRTEDGTELATAGTNGDSSTGADKLDSVNRGITIPFTTFAGWSTLLLVVTGVVAELEVTTFRKILASGCGIERDESGVAASGFPFDSCRRMYAKNDCLICESAVIGTDLLRSLCALLCRNAALIRSPGTAVLIEF